MNRSMIHAEKLSKRYAIGLRSRERALRNVLGDFMRRPWNALRRRPKEFIWALRDLSLDVREGEVVGLVGRNGAGKTTLLRILSRITRPTDGFAEVRGRVGSLLEVGTGFHTELTGRENVFFSGAILGMKRREILRKFDEIVSFAEVEKFIDTPLKHFSTGMQMRLAFAVAAHLEPEILLVDEVLAVGDLKFQKKCLGKMGEAASGGRTIVFVSHQMNQIRRLCQRVLWIDQGAIRQEGPTAQVVGAYESAMTSGQWSPEVRPDGPKVKGRFLGWRILRPDGREATLLDWQGPVAFCFDLEALQPLRMCHHGIALYDAEGRLMWGTATDGLELAAGRQQFIYTLPDLPLKPGVYNWRLSLYDEFGTVDVCFPIPDLIVGTEPLTHYMDEWAGVLNIPARFEVQAAALEAESARGL